MRRLLVVAVALTALGQRAYAIDGVLNARGVGLGGAARASAQGALAALLNPSGLTLSHEYDIEAVYGFDVQSLGSTLHLAIADSATNAHVAMGIYYTFVHNSPRYSYQYCPSAAKAGCPPFSLAGDNGRQGHETGLALAVPIGARFSLGLTSKYVTVSTQTNNPDSGMPGAPATFTLDNSTSAASADGFTLDVGATVRITESLNLGVVGYNLVPLYSIEAPIGLGFGVSYLIAGKLLVAVDAVVDFNKYRDAENNRRTTSRVAGGLEYVAAGIVPIRVGVSGDTGLPATYLSVGLGYKHRSFGIDLAYRQQVAGGSDAFLSAGLRVFLQ
jgi:hypothetical protein